MGTIDFWAVIRLAAILLVLSGVAKAADISVIALESASRKPIDGVAVCLGTPANPVQFGRKVSDRDGVALFADVPHTPIVLTLSKPSYRGFRNTYPAKRFNLVLEVVMHTGGLGPECDVSVGDLPIETETRLIIDVLSINQNAQATTEAWVTLSSMVEGSVSHYRASERADFFESDWKPYLTTVKFRLSEPPGPKTIYFQVRRYSGSTASHVETVSDTVSAKTAYH